MLLVAMLSAESDQHGCSCNLPPLYLIFSSHEKKHHMKESCSKLRRNDDRALQITLLYYSIDFEWVVFDVVFRIFVIQICLISWVLYMKM